MEDFLGFFICMDLPTTTFQDKKLAVNRKTGKPMIFDSEEVKKIKANFRDELIPYVPKKRLRGPIMVLTKWCFGFKEENHFDGEFKVTKPDVDNLNKILLDTMTRLNFWKDDAEVARLITEKFWSELPGVYVAIKEL